MAVGLDPPGRLLPVPGLRIAAGSAGIYRVRRPDLCLIELAAGARAAAVFTRNIFCAAPVTIARRHLGAAAPRYCLINAGNANAGCGEQGVAAAVAACAGLARLAGCETEQVLPFSTGVIGQPLPVAAIASALPALHAQLAPDRWLEACRAIMTTDTVPKAISRTAVVDGVPVTVTGMAKGSGMIHPDMATMLAFIATDAPVTTPVLQVMLDEAIASSFNRISVDGDTSTNDAVLLISTGAGRVPELADSRDSRGSDLFRVIRDVCNFLAQAVVRDGEGATKFIAVQVDQGASARECLEIARAVAGSPLVKTAFFASDPNWGRILAAVGRAAPPDLDVSLVSISLNGLLICEGGGLSARYTEAAGKAVMKESEIKVHIRLGRGAHAETMWTCDLSYDYVKINADYRS